MTICLIMHHFGIKRESLKKVSETGILLVKKFRYRIMHNLLADIGLLKRGFLSEIQLGIPCQKRRFKDLNFHYIYRISYINAKKQTPKMRFAFLISKNTMFLK